MNDQIFLEIRGGEPRGPFGASVQGNKIFTEETSVDFEEEQIVFRKLPSGRPERYKITNAHWAEGMGMSHWQLDVVKVDSQGLPKGSGGSRAAGSTINISGSTGIQIGNDNTQNLIQSLNAVLEAIDQSDSPEGEKKTVRSIINDLVSHPLFTAIAGGVAGGITGTLSN